MEKAARVLVVADDPQFRAYCARCLEPDGHDVIDATNGPDALEMIQRAQPDVIIMAAVMPGMDGLECTRRIRAGPAKMRVPIIMISAATSTEDVVAGLEAGADEYIAKPLDPKELRLRVQPMVHLSQAYRAMEQSSETLGEQNRALGILLELSCDLNAEAGLARIAERVVFAAAELVGCRSVSVMLPDDERRTLKLAAGTDFDPAQGGEASILVGEGISGRAFRIGRPIVFDDAEKIRRACHPSELPRFQGAAAVAAPLCASDQALGVLNIANRVFDRPFKPQELAYLDIIANLAASSIHDSLARKARDDAYESIMIALAKLTELRDDDTGKHLDRVTQFSLTLAEELRSWEDYEAGIDDAFLHGLRLAVPLHDIGKVAVPDRILLKPGQLTAEENQVMRRHVDIGADTVRSVLNRASQSRFLWLAEEICRCHHERYDGSGYPRGLAGKEIPLSARIAAIADVYDALTTRRVYKPPMAHRQAFDLIVHAAGTQFDPDVVKAFIACEQAFIELGRELADSVDVCDADPVAYLAESSPIGRR